MRTFFALSLALVLALALAAPARAVPTTMTYAGVLKDGATPVNSTVDVTFTLFNASTAGNVLYTETQNGIVVVGGDLVADIGQNGLDDTLLDAPQLWLEVTVDGDVLDPRVRLESVPYALHADRAAHADAADDASTLEGLASADFVTHAELTTLHLDQGISAGNGITITNGTIAIGTITAAMIGAGAVGSNALAPDAVDTTKIRDLTITTNDISATANIAGSKLLADSVTATQIGPNAVTSSELASNAVVAGKIASGTIRDFDVSTTAAIAGSKLASDSVTGTQLRGVEVNVFRLVIGCGSTALTTASSCTTIACPGFQQFQNCSGTCVSSATPLTCTPLVAVGRLLSTTN